MLRAALIACGVLLVAGGVIVIHASGSVGWPAAVQLLLGGIVLLFAMLFEARRYRAGEVSKTGAWEPTGERFVDPTTGRLTEVRYNPQTGEREYIESH